MIRTSATGVWSSQTYLNGEFVAGGISAQSSSGYVIPAGVDEIRGSIANNGWNTGIVTKNNADLTYEPYTGGKASPNPDYPQPILSVDELALEVHGKNLLQITGTSGPHGGITYTVNADSTISASGTESSTGYPFDIGTVHVMAGQTYHLSGCPAGGSTSTYRMYPANKPGSWYDTGNGATFTPTADETLTIRIVIGGGATYSNLVFKPQLELGSTATAYEPYQGHTVPLYDGDLRSLPDGTKDTLNLSYLRPSTRPGWAWYSREIVRRIEHATIDRATNVGSNAGGPFMRHYLTTAGINTNAAYSNALCSHFAIGTIAQQGNCIVTSAGAVAIFTGPMFDTQANAEAWVAANTPSLDYPLATPFTTQLDPIELPTLPAPTATVWCDGGSAQPTYTMEYVRNTSIVIANLEAAIADLATS